MGYCHYAVIYRKSPVGLPAPRQLAMGPQAEGLNRLLQELAWDAVIHHPLSGVTAGARTVSATGHGDPRAPKGTVKTFSFSESRIFPGTKRSGSVFIPAQYDRAKPACVYVRQDGYNPAEKGMLESLIAAGEMPVTVGVFVSPGDLPAPMKDTLGRRNRCFEYDGVGDNYVRFLIEELLPFVAKKFDLKLSTSGNDRCIAGGSSGGISAFNAAWERPDAFSRVYANSGSFVAFRGGHEFPTLDPQVRGQADPRLSHDRHARHGELRRRLVPAGPGNGQGPEVLRLRLLLPRHRRAARRRLERVLSRSDALHLEGLARAGQGRSERAARARRHHCPNEGWELAAEGFTDARGPACNAKGEVFFADPAADKVHRIGLDGKTSVFLADAGQAKRLSVGPKGEVYTVSEATGKVMCYDEAGARRVVAKGIPGRYVLARPDGTLYITGPGDDIRRRQPDLARQATARDRGRLGAEARHRAGLPSRPVAAFGGRRQLEVGLQLPDQRRRHAGQQGALLLAARAGLGR